MLLDELELEIHLVKEGSVMSEERRSSDKFMHGIKVVMAKNYVDNLSEEARKGMAEKAEQGIWPTKSPVGYRNVTLPGGKRVIEIDPTSGPVIARMFELYANGDMGLRELSRWVRAQGSLSPRGKYAFPISKVHQILTSLIYTGDFVYKGRVHKGVHDPLVSRDLWDRVQERLEDRSCHAPKDQKHVWQALIGGYLANRPPLAGLVLIMDCRHPLTELDRSLLDWFKPSGKPVHVLLSKSDKLSRGPALQTLRQVRDELANLGLDASGQLFSSRKREGVDEAEGVLRHWLGVPKKNPAQGEGAG